MKKIGGHIYYEDVDLHLNFDFNDLMEFFKKSDNGVKKEFFNEDGTLKFDLIEKYVNEYVNKKIKQKYGEDFSLDVMDDTMNISWDIKVESVKERYVESWWNGKQKKELTLPKLKKTDNQNSLEHLLENPHLIPYGNPDDKK